MLNNIWAAIDTCGTPDTVFVKSLFMLLIFTQFFHKFSKPEAASLAIRRWWRKQSKVLDKSMKQHQQGNSCQGFFTIFLVSE